MTVRIMDNKVRLFYILVSALSLMGTSAVNADHLDENQLSIVPVEDTLCGFRINQSSVHDIEAKLGKHIRVITDVTGALTYVWKVGQGELEGTVWSSEGGMQAKVYALIVQGQNLGTCGRTGDGLTLGGSVTDIQHIYGRYGRPDKTSAIVQWESGAEIDIDLDSAARIDKMTLISGGIE